MKGQIYSGKSSGLILSSSFSILLLSYTIVSIVWVLLVLNSISWCFILQLPGHLVNFIVPFFQLISELCLTNQLWPKNMSVPFKSVTTAFSCSLCPLIFYFQRCHLGHLSILHSIYIENFKWEVYQHGLYLFFLNQLLVNFHMYASRVYQCLDLEVFAILCLHICSHIQFSFYITPLVWNNIFILRIYRGDLLYYVYLRSSPKSYFFFFSLLFSSSSDSSWIFYFFIDCFLLQSLAMCSSLLHLKHFLISFSFFFQHSFTMWPYLL